MLNENNFITKLDGDSVDIYGIPEFKGRLGDNHECNATAQVSWELCLEMRSWGLKNISAYATYVQVEIEVSWWMDDGDDEVETVTIDSEDGWEIESDMDTLEMSDSIFPQAMEVNFDTKTITINF